jgi:hypothetical protein
LPDDDDDDDDEGAAVRSAAPFSFCALHLIHFGVARPE